MKKGLALIGVVIAALVIYYFLNREKAPEQVVEKQQPLVQGKHSAAFSQSVNDLLQGYYSVKDALVEWDTAATSSAAVALSGLATKIPFNELQADTTIKETAKSFTESIAAEATAIAGEADIEGKRRSFYTLSENLYNFLRTVQYDQQVIYHAKCPMAFNDTEEAFWLSNSKEIVNPYLGKHHPKYHAGMLSCGSVQDSIDYRPK